MYLYMYKYRAWEGRATYRPRRKRMAVLKWMLIKRLKCWGVNVFS
jgi:hypothetical protein